MQETTINNVHKTYPDINTGKFAIGNPGGGRPKGSKNFRTMFEEAILGIKDVSTGQQLEMTDIVRMGIQRMLDRDDKFEVLYKDVLDRYFGKAVNKIEDSAEMGVVITDDCIAKAKAVIEILNSE
jgi:hypothetical protein